MQVSDSVWVSLTVVHGVEAGSSAAVGEIIKLGGKLISSEVQLHLQNYHLPFVIQHIMPSGSPLQSPEVLCISPDIS